MHRPSANLPVDESILSILEEHGSSEAKDMVGVFLREHPNSFPRLLLDDYVFDDGRQEVVLRLVGGVSIVYGGGHYKLPAYIILPQSFPVEGPIVYMNPNESMIRNTKSPYVDANFMVCTDYIGRWQYPYSNLCHMYEDMKAKFSKAPPLKNKTSSSTSAYSLSPFSSCKEHEIHDSIKNRKRLEGLNAIKASLSRKINDILNSWLDSGFNEGKEKFFKLLEKHKSLENDILMLKNEREELDDCISECASTISKLDRWLMQEEHKSAHFSRSNFQSDIDAYRAIVASNHDLNDILESDACIDAVNSATSNADEALFESRVQWSDYKKILSQLAYYKFQAKILNNKGKKSQNKQPDVRIEGVVDNNLTGYPLLQSDIGSEELDNDNPMKSL